MTHLNLINICLQCASDCGSPILYGWRSLYSCSLRAERSGDRIPVGARIPSPVQTGSGTHPPSCAMGTESFPGLRRPEHGAEHPSPSRAEVKERV